MRSVADRPSVRERRPGAICDPPSFNGHCTRQPGGCLGLPEFGTCLVQLQLDPLPLGHAIGRGLAPPGLGGEPLGVPRSGRSQRLLCSDQLRIRFGQCIRSALPCPLRGLRGVQRRIQRCGRLAILGGRRAKSLLRAESIQLSACRCASRLQVTHAPVERLAAALEADHRLARHLARPRRFPCGPLSLPVARLGLGHGRPFGGEARAQRLGGSLRGRLPSPGIAEHLPQAALTPPMPLLHERAGPTAEQVMLLLVLGLQREASDLRPELPEQVADARQVLLGPAEPPE